MILKIQEHLTQREHPIRVILDFFQDQFAKVYAELVDSGSGDSKQLINKIQSMGREFAIQVFKSVNEFVSAVFETLLALYDPNIEGFLEEAERDLDRLALTRTVFGQTYYVLIVLSRVMNKDKDKDLRLRVQALAGVSPQDFGVDDYLLLNKEAPMMKMVKTQSDDFVRMSQQMMRKSVLRSSTQTNPKNFLPKFSSVYKSRDSTLSSDSTVFEKADDSRGSLSAEVILEDEDEYLQRQSS